MPSTKFPCGECKTECNNGSISCFKCGEWFHSGECSGGRTNTLRAILKWPGLIWLCKTFVDSWKTLKEGIRSDDPLAEKLELFEMRFTESQSNAKSAQQKMKQKIDEQLRKTETSLDEKINTIIEKQNKIPTAIKNAWSKGPPNQPSLSVKKVSKETLTQQEREKENMEKRENDLVLFNAPDRGKQNAEERQNEDEVNSLPFASTAFNCLLIVYRR